MTEESYWRNVARGVTGPETDTCLLASFDRISLRYGISPQTYVAYQRLRSFFEVHIGDGANYAPPDFVARKFQLDRQFYKELGVERFRSARWLRARSVEELDAMLSRLCAGGFRAIVYCEMFGGLHTIGFKRIGSGLYEARSTGTEFDDDQRVSVEEIFFYMEQPSRHRLRPHSARKTFATPNIQVLPPEPGVRRGR